MEIKDLSYQLKYYPLDKFFKLARRKILNRASITQFDSAHPCVFVLSTGRVGSQTLAHLYMQAKNVFAYHEAEPQLFGLSASAYMVGDASTDNEKLAQVLRQGFLTARKDLLDLSLHCGKGYVETGPHNTFLAPIILSLYPTAKFIHLVRSPKDVVKSGMRRNWYNGHHYDSVRILPQEGSPYEQIWQEMDAIERNIWLWAETNHWITNFLSTLPDSQRITLRSEDIFNGQEDTIQDLYKFIGSDMPSRRSINRILKRKMNAQHTGIFKLSSDWLESTRKELKTFLRESAISLGYEIE